MALVYLAGAIMCALGFWIYTDNKKKKKLLANRDSNRLLDFAQHESDLAKKNIDFRNVYEFRKNNKADRYISFQVEGIHVRDRRDYIENNLTDYLQLTFVPEPNNPHDVDAIAIKHIRKKIGYVPKHKTNYVHQLIQAGLYMVYVYEMKWEDDYFDVTVRVDFK